MNAVVADSPTSTGTPAVAAARSSDLMQALAEIEGTVPVDEWTVGGIAIWPLLRIRWFFAEWARERGHRVVTLVAAEIGAGPWPDPTR